MPWASKGFGTDPYKMADSLVTWLEMSQWVARTLSELLTSYRGKACVTFSHLAFYTDTSTVHVLTAHLWAKKCDISKSNAWLYISEGMKQEECHRRRSIMWPSSKALTRSLCHGTAVQTITPLHVVWCWLHKCALQMCRQRPHERQKLCLWSQ